MAYPKHPRQHENAQGSVSVDDALRTALADNTRRAYRNGWKRFAAHCDDRRVDPVAATPEDVAEFVVTMVSHSQPEPERNGGPLALGTIRICLAAISQEYRQRDLRSPTHHRTVAAVLRGLGRQAISQPRQVKALREHEVAAILSHCDQRAARDSHRSIASRDGALIAVGFAAALRRSEICRLQYEDVEFVGSAEPHRGMFLHIRRSKTDQLGQGHRIAVPRGRLIRPVERLRHWLGQAGITRGPLFPSLYRGGRSRGRALHPSDVARLVKHYAGTIGLDSDQYSGHSLRAGFVTSAAVHHARLDKIMAVTRHRKASMVLEYIRHADAFDDHAGADFL